MDANSSASVAAESPVEMELVVGVESANAGRLGGDGGTTELEAEGDEEECRSGLGRAGSK